MKYSQYQKKIREKCERLGTWRPEFDKVAERLAAIYERIDLAEAEFRARAELTVGQENVAGGVKVTRNPLLVELAAMYDQALACERELGLTAAALKKMNEEALKPRQQETGLAATLRLLEG